MKSKNIILIIFFAISALTAGWLVIKKQPMTAVNYAHKDIYYCPMHPQYTSDHPGDCPICHMKLVKKENLNQTKSTSTTPAANKEILYWTDPMIPGYKAKGPGKSPMGMDLVPVYSEAVPAGDVESKNEKDSSTKSVQGYSTVSIDTQKQQLIGIRTVTVTKKPLVKTIHTYGYVAHDFELYDAQLEYISAWQQYYAFQARRPIKGEFSQDWREYYMKAPTKDRWRSDEKVKAQQRLVKAEYELKHMGLNDEQIAQLRKVKYGQPWIQPDLLFFEKGHPLWIYAQVLESDLWFISAGQKVLVTIPAYGDESIEGLIRNVSLEIDPNTRTTRVRIELPNSNYDLKVNMYVNVNIPVEMETASLVIPREAVMDTGLRKIVFVETQEGRFEPRDVETSYEGDGMVAVKSGLKDGERIVSSGNFLLDSESRLQASLIGGPTQ